MHEAALNLARAVQYRSAGTVEFLVDWSPEQRQQMERHTVLGHEALRGGSDLLQLGADIALHHHERWDGGGYPRAIAGADIPAAARVVSLADVLDALVSPRPWRTAWAPERALSHVRAGEGSQFDPMLVDVVVANQANLLAVHRQFLVDGARPADDASPGMQAPE